MKKFLLSLGIIGIFGGIFSFASANNPNCKKVEFSNGVTACVNIEKVSTNRWKLITTASNASTANLRCDIMTPDSILRFRDSSSCNQEFTYNGQGAGRTKIWIRYVVSYQNELAPSNREGKPNSNSERRYPQWEYNFGRGERFSDYNNNNNNNNNSNTVLNNFSLSANTTTPSSYQYLDLTIRARDRNNYTLNDYRGTVNFKVYYRAPNSSTWIQTTSSSYYTMSSNYSNGYTFISSNNGVKTLSNFIKFNKNNYEYKVNVYDRNNSSLYQEIIFNVGNGNNNSNTVLNNFSLSANTTTPSTYQYLDLTIRARDRNNYTLNDYRGTVNFKVYYRAPNSSTWIQTTSSSYYTMSSHYSNGYTFISSNNGVKTLSNFIKFNKNNYEYKVNVYDRNNSSLYQEIIFNVGDNGSSSNINGFTSSELNTVKSMYNKRDAMIDDLENEYAKLRNSSTRHTMSNSFRTAMQEIINNNSNKRYKNYDTFYDGWLDWYRYTVSIR